MDELMGAITLFQILIPIGGCIRISACLSYMAMEEDPAPYKKRIRNVLIFVALSECFSSIFHVALGYLGGTVISY